MKWIEVVYLGTPTAAMVNVDQIATIEPCIVNPESPGFPELGWEVHMSNGRAFRTEDDVAQMVADLVTKQSKQLQKVLTFPKSKRN